MLSILVLVSFSSLSVFFSPAQAKLIPTARVLEGGSPDSERARLKAFLEREEVQNQLEAWGLDKKMAKTRVDSLTNEEVTRMVQRLDQLPAGGNGVVAVVFASVLIFILLLVTDIMGYTDIFPFVKKYP